MKNSIKLFFKRNSKKLAVGALAALIAATALTGCSSSSSGVSIAVPNDTTNEARALLLLEHNGYIKLKDGAGITATIKDIVENPYNITFKEIEAAQLPNTLKDQDYAVINSNYAIQADLNPVKDSLLIEDSSSQYSNIVAVKEGSENSDKTKALVAALESKDVADYISQTYNGAVVSVVENPGDGYDSSVNYDALGGQTITVAASPTPHAEILKVAKEILAKKKTLRLTSKSSPTMFSRTMLLTAARLMLTTSSTSRISMTLTHRTRPTSYPRRQSTLNRSVSTAESKALLTR